MHKQHKYALRGRAVTFYTSVNDVFLPHSSPSQQQQQWKSLGEEEGEWHRLDVPLDAEVSVFADQLLIQLRSDWTLPSALTCTPDSSSGSSSGSSRDGGPGLCFKQGTLLATPLEAFVLNRRQGVAHDAIFLYCFSATSLCSAALLCITLLLFCHFTLFCFVLACL